MGHINSPISWIGTVLLSLILMVAVACGETKTIEVPGETITIEVPGQTVVTEVVKEVQVPGETITVVKEVV